MRFVVKLVLEMIGLATVIWFIWVAVEEYKKIQQEHKEKSNGRPRGL